MARLVQDLHAAQGTDLDTATEAALAKAAEHSLRNLWHGCTSTLEEFARPVGAQRRLARAARLFTSVPELPDSAGDDSARIEAVIRRAGEEIGRRRTRGAGALGLGVASASLLASALLGTERTAPVEHPGTGQPDRLPPAGPALPEIPGTGVLRPDDSGHALMVRTK
ncbi:hypothetical protein SUDANB176_00340 [Streptomyces sp. enrichment culture]|uniref:hypothetical protein n=1 Tax=Streptomyces sp. enrichment culture TaxID=1795815 RepID=UPI003F558245